MLGHQYYRLGLPVTATNREVIRAAHGLLSGRGKTHAMRETRHRWLRSILKRHEKAFDEFVQATSGAGVQSFTHRCTYRCRACGWVYVGWVETDCEPEPEELIGGCTMCAHENVPMDVAEVDA